jgi:hypothetical protein
MVDWTVMSAPWTEATVVSWLVWYGFSQKTFFVMSPLNGSIAAA